MTVPRDGEPLCPTRCVVLRGRRGVIVSRPKTGECTWCGKTITDARRSTWCSHVCVGAYQATQPEYQREVLRERDQGVCVACGLRTERLRRTAARWLRRQYDQRRLRYAVVDGRRRAIDHRDHMAALLTHLGRTTSVRMSRHLMGERLKPGGSWWDVDHTVPISEGGHPYDPRNLRTLCVWCHAGVTAEQASRRAERRRGAREDTGQVDMFG